MEINLMPTLTTNPVEPTVEDVTQPQEQIPCDFTMLLDKDISDKEVVDKLCECQSGECTSCVVDFDKVLKEDIYLKVASALNHIYDVRVYKHRGKLIVKSLVHVPIFKRIGYWIKGLFVER